MQPEWCRPPLPGSQCYPSHATSGYRSFQPNESSLEADSKQWQIEHSGAALRRKDFPALLQQTWAKVATFENVGHRFRKARLFPLNRDGIDKSKLAEKVNDGEQGRNEEGVSETEINKDQTDQNKTAPEVPNIPCVEDQPMEIEPEQSTSTITDAQQETTCVSPAFSKLRVPQPNGKKTV